MPTAPEMPMLKGLHDYLQGGGFRTGCRFFSCCFLTFIFLLVSVILTILLVSPFRASVNDRSAAAYYRDP